MDRAIHAVVVPPGLFRLVHHLVGVSNQLFGLGEGSLRDDEPTLQVMERSRPSSNTERGLPAGSVADKADVIVIAERLTQHDELIAP